MWRAVRTRAVRSAEPHASPNARRDRLAKWAAAATLVGIVAAFVLAKDNQFLMPGPLASAHSAIENCNACHTKSGDGRLSWLHGLVAGDRHADSKACLGCHQMPDTAFNAHGTSEATLLQSTERLRKVAATTPAPLSARAQDVASPTGGMVARGVNCTSCHQEHLGTSFKLNQISNEQCRSCHIVKFDSFDGGHPTFDNYPFRRRTRLIFDHAGHFGKHFPEVSKKDPARRIPESCSSCHTSRDDKRVMSVAPFEQTCTGCHLDQIAGKERASGPKGIAFLTLPGLDLATLKKRNAAIGEWPEASEAELTPFMKVLIGRSARGRELIKTIDSLNLQDLSKANDQQIRAVTQLAWEIKRLYHALISGKASDVLADLGMGGDVKPRPNVVADLTASLPRDVVVSAHQQWLPNLGTEMANRKETREPAQGGWITTISESRLPRDGKGAEPDRTAAVPVRAAPEDAARPDPVSQRPSRAAPQAGDRPPTAKGADQTDDLLYPTEEERRAMAAAKGGGRASPPGAASGPAPATAAAPAPSADSADKPAAAPPPVTPAALAAPAVSIKSKVDPESWAEYGGWYRQDFGIYYRPTVHKDRFIHAWLVLTGPQAPRGGKGPAAAVFNALTSKDAQGACTKCHSVDDIGTTGRYVNFSPPTPKSKQGRFTQFVHEPHLSILDQRGCMTCHKLEKDRPYLTTFEKGDPHQYASNFGAVNKDLCRSCHTSSMARQDCLLCHKYHVDGVVTPMMGTKIPNE